MLVIDVFILNKHRIRSFILKEHIYLTKVMIAYQFLYFFQVNVRIVYDLSC